MQTIAIEEVTMPNTLNGQVSTQLSENEPLKASKITRSTDDWSYATKELVDALPQIWTRGLLYFLAIFIAIVLPWAMLSRLDEIGTAKGRLEPKGKTVKLDAAVTGTVKEIRVKEGDAVKAGQSLLVLESDLVNAELQQAQDKLEGQFNRLAQLNLLKTQLLLALSTQQQQNKAQDLEKQTQVAQAQHNLETLRAAYNLQKAEKLSQVNQAKETFESNQKAYKLIQIRLANSWREVERYQKTWQEGITAEIQVAEREDLAQERQGLYDKAESDVEQGKLHLAEQQNSYQRTTRQAQADIAQAQLRLKEQQRNYQSLTISNQLAVLKVKEQLKNLETDTTTLKAEIAQSKGQIGSLQFQLKQRVLTASVSGTVFQLPIQRPGAVVQPGTTVAEIAPLGSPLVIRAQMPTAESGSLHRGLPVKLKFDAYPFQDYGIVEGQLLEISPTTSEVETSNGKVAVYNLEISLNQDCIPTANKCIALRPGETATAEVIIRQRRIIDLILDPFKKLQKGG